MELRADYRIMPKELRSGYNVTPQEPSTFNMIPYVRRLPTPGGDSTVNIICPWAVPCQDAALLDTVMETARKPDHGQRTGE